MGYTTKFSGDLKLSRKLTMAEAKELLSFSEDPDTIPAPKPSSYMQWVPSESLDRIVWDGQEKFYNYTEWLDWLCKLLGARGIEVDGLLKWSGESADDTGELVVVKNVVNACSRRPGVSISYRPLTLGRLREMALDQLTNE